MSNQLSLIRQGEKPRWWDRPDYLCSAEATGSTVQSQLCEQSVCSADITNE